MSRRTLFPQHVASMWCAMFAVLFGAILLFAASGTTERVHKAESRWVGSWAAAQQLVEPTNALSPDDLHETTLRQIVHLSLGGNEIRLRLSNRFGDAPLHIAAVRVATPVSSSSGKIMPGSDKKLTFSGAPDVIIPARADCLSDPISFPVKPLSDVAISLLIEEAPSRQTGHPGSRATSYALRGDFVVASELPGAKTIDHWYFISGIDVLSPSQGSAIVVLGDSITDGHGVSTNGNDRWPDVLAQRLQERPATRELAVLNQGIGGNRLLNDGVGPNALSRFEDDVIAQPGVKFLIVLEGVNDIGMLVHDGEVSRAEHEALVHQIITAYQQIIAGAHAHYIKVIGATIMPFVGSSYYHPGPASEADREAVNEWIRSSRRFDAVIDFDKITRDPQHPERLLPRFDSGDHLHPSPVGYAAMANAVPLSIFSLLGPLRGTKTNIGPTLSHASSRLPGQQETPNSTIQFPEMIARRVGN